MPRTVDIAIEECKRFGVKYEWKYTTRGHIKFYVGGRLSPVFMGSGHKSSNFDRIAGKIRVDIRKAIEGLR